MKRLITVLALTLMSLLPSITIAKQPTAGDLLQACKATYTDWNASPNDAVAALDAGFCLGLIGGFISYSRAEITVAEHRNLSSNFSLMCPPPTVSSDQGVRIVMKYIEDHPEIMHKDGGGIALFALTNAFPCN